MAKIEALTASSLGHLPHLGKGDVHAYLLINLPLLHETARDIELSLILLNQKYNTMGLDDHSRMVRTDYKGRIYFNKNLNGYEIIIKL